MTPNNTEGHLRQAAYSFLANGFSDPYLQKNAARLPAFVDAIVAANEAHKVYDLLRLSHTTPPHPHST
jgi:hypothetical protein